MKVLLQTVLFLTFASGAIAAPSPKGLSLDECYKKALEMSERVLRSQNEIELAEAQYQESVSAVLPKVNLSGSERYRSDPGGRSFDSNNDLGSPTSSRTSSDDHATFSTAVSVSQPIFSGFRDLLLIEAAKSEISGRKFDTVRTREVLYLDVAESFHQTLLYEDQIVELTKTLEVLNQRVKELTERVDLGKSREGEVLSAKAGSAETAAALEITKGLLNASREALAFLTGVPSKELELRRSPSPVKPASLETYLEQSARRADIFAAGDRKSAVEKQVLAAKREWWPTVALQGNYYPYVSDGEDNDWDVLLRLQVPIFDGGGIKARTAQAEAVLKRQDLTLLELTRVAERDTRIAYQNVLSSRNQVAKLRQSVKSSEANYESQVKDYRIGVVDNIEVLQSIRQLHDVRRELLDAEANVEINLARLEVASGRVPR